MEATKNISCMKGKGEVNESTVTRWLEKFCLDCKDFDDQVW